MMDPNEILDSVRESCRALTGEKLDRDDEHAHLYAVMQGFRDLDNWLSRGGFPPDAWVEPMKRAAVAAQSAGIDPLGPPDPAGVELPGTHYYGDGHDHA
jgi:hypothetical protein